MSEVYLFLFLNFSADNDLDELNVTLISFSIGATQGSVKCVNVTFIDDDVTEQLECFTFAAATAFVPVCIEDNDGRL